MKHLVAATAMTLSVSACSSGGACFGPAAADQVVSLDGYEGRSESDARDLARRRGVTLRVVGADGVCTTQEADLQVDRVNVYLESGVVREAQAY